MGSIARKGDDQLRAQDDSIKLSAFGILDNMYDDYVASAGPGGFFDKKLKRVREDAEAKVTAAKDQFTLLKDQQAQSLRQGESSGEIAYQQALAKSNTDLRAMTEKANMQAVAARDTSSEDAFSVSDAVAKSGLAGVGDRARKALGKRRKESVDAINLGLRLQKESTEQNLAATEQKVNADRSSAAMAMTQNTENAAFNMDTSRKEINRGLRGDVSDIEEARASALSDLIEKSHTLKQNTEMAFKDQYSTWPRDNEGGSGFLGFIDPHGEGNIEDPGIHDWDLKTTPDAFKDYFNEIDII